MYDSESNIDQIYKGVNLRPIAMAMGGNQIVLSPGRDIDRNLPRDNNYDNIRLRLIIKTCMVISLPKMI